MTCISSKVSKEVRSSRKLLTHSAISSGQELKRSQHSLYSVDDDTDRKLNGFTFKSLFESDTCEKKSKNHAGRVRASETGLGESMANLLES